MSAHVAKLDGLADRDVLARSTPGFPSIVQSVWDHRDPRSHLMLVLTGSVIGAVGSMPGARGALRGRPTPTLRLDPVDLAGARAFWFGVLYADLALIEAGQGRAVLTRRRPQWERHLVSCYRDSRHFGPAALDRRLLRGGLPELLLHDRVDPDWYAEWLASFYARDVQDLFGIRERTGFLNLLRLRLRQSGGLADYSALARECDLSRPTVKAHLEAMTVALTPVAPFHGGARRELVRRPKIYTFDTGFVAFWRDKSNREIEFVVARGTAADAIECTRRPDRLEPRSLDAFRAAYPRGRNVVVSPGVSEPYDFRVGKYVVRAVGCADLLQMYPR